MRMHLHNLAFLTTLAIGVALGQTASNPQQIPSQKPGNQLQPAQQAKASADIQNDIQSALQKDPSLAKANISVQVTEQNVELSGTVPTREAKNTAEQIARTHSGGLEVKNNLRVGDSN